MPHELLVGLHVVDEPLYRKYREAMTPILHAHGGGFRNDFLVSQALCTSAEHPVNRVFTIHFAHRDQREAFFGDPEYVKVRARWFATAVDGSTILAEYEC